MSEVLQLVWEICGGFGADVWGYLMNYFAEMISNMNLLWALVSVWTVFGIVLMMVSQVRFKYGEYLLKRERRVRRDYMIGVRDVKTIKNKKSVVLADLVGQQQRPQWWAIFRENVASKRREMLNKIK